MGKFLIALAIVTALLAAGLIQLFRSRRSGMPSQEVLDRAAVRERELEARERAERRDRP